MASVGAGADLVDAALHLGRERRVDFDIVRAD